MEQKLIILVGPPASGKSTWAKKYVQDNPGSVRVCRDDFRYHFTPHWEFNKKNERIITELEESSTWSWLYAGKTVIIDATNLRRDSVDRFKAIAKLVGGESIYVIEKLFDVTLDTCIQRNASRVGNEYVPLEILKNMYKKFEQLKEIL